MARGRNRVAIAMWKGEDDEGATRGSPSHTHPDCQIWEDRTTGTSLVPVFGVEKSEGNSGLLGSAYSCKQPLHEYRDVTQKRAGSCGDGHSEATERRRITETVRGSINCREAHTRGKCTGAPTPRNPTGVGRRALRADAGCDGAARGRDACGKRLSFVD